MSPVTIIGVIILTLTLCGTFGYRQFALQSQKAEYAKQITDLKKQKKQLSKEKEDLKDFREYVKTDEYAEEIAREKLGLIHKGEILFVPEER